MKIFALIVSILLVGCNHPDSNAHTRDISNRVESFCVHGIEYYRFGHAIFPAYDSETLQVKRCGQ